MVEFGAKSESPSAGCFRSCPHVFAPSPQCERLKHAIPAGFICSVVLSMYETEDSKGCTTKLAGRGTVSLILDYDERFQAESELLQ